MVGLCVVIIGAAGVSVETVRNLSLNCRSIRTPSVFPIWQVLIAFKIQRPQHFATITPKADIIPLTKRSALLATRALNWPLSDISLVAFIVAAVCFRLE